MFWIHINKIIDIYYELVWAMELEADVDTLSQTKEGRSLVYYLVWLRWKVKCMIRICNKIEPRPRINVRGNRANCSHARH